MDTYGHLFSGQEADAVGRLNTFMNEPLEEMRATGTTDVCLTTAAPRAQRVALRAQCDSMQFSATECDEPEQTGENPDHRNALPIAMLCNVARRCGAVQRNDRPGGIRTIFENIDETGCF
jgi:hypothetical protein